MKTLQQKEREYANNSCCEDCKYNIGIDHKKCDIGGNCDAYNSFIADFRAGYNALQHETRWRSVEEELPKDQGVVMVKTNTGSFATAYLHGKSSGFITYGTEAYLDFGIITHWKPIE